jgi:hypothetical protein
MAETLTLTLPLEKRGPAGAFVLTDAQAAAIGDGKKAFPVTVTVNGTDLTLRVARMGGENLIGLAKAARAEAGVELGETYEIQVTRAEANQPTDIPDDLSAAFADSPDAKSAFEALAPSHRKEFVRWITEAKRDTTRTQRVTKTIDMLLAGEHR